MIVTWFLKDDEETASFFPNVGAQSTDARAVETYLRCVYCFYLTSLSANPNVPHAFFTNSTALTIGSLDLLNVLESWGIQLHHVPLTYRVPSTWQAAFRNQFYVYDIIERLSADDRPDWALIADSDCVWNGPCNRIATTIMQDGVGSISLDYPESKVTNGLSRIEMRQIMPSLGLSPHGNQVPEYCGGEAIGLRKDTCCRIASQSRLLFERILKHHAKDHSFICEEAHVFSMMCCDMQLPCGNLNGMVKRIWTAQRFRNTSPQDIFVHLWHLPAEKRYGFEDLYATFAKHQRSFGLLSDGERSAQLRKYLGVPKRSFSKVLLDSKKRLYRRGR